MTTTDMRLASILRSTDGRKNGRSNGRQGVRQMKRYVRKLKKVQKASVCNIQNHLTFIIFILIAEPSCEKGGSQQTAEMFDVSIGFHGWLHVGRLRPGSKTVLLRGSQKRHLRLLWQHPWFVFELKKIPPLTIYGGWKKEREERQKTWKTERHVK